jgi:hypothetical protein
MRMLPVIQLHALIEDVLVRAVAAVATNLEARRLSFFQQPINRRAVYP